MYTRLYHLMHTNIRGLGKYADDPIIIDVTEGIKLLQETPQTTTKLLVLG